MKGSTKKIMRWFVVKNIQRKFKTLSLDIVLPVFFLSLILEMAHFFPTLRNINIWDEASYVFYGYRLLIRGEWLNLADSPLSSMLYALTMLPVIHSPDFFVLSIAISRILLFILVFFSVYLIARELRPYANPWIMLALVFIVPVATTMYLFPSDVLFAGFSGLAFWKMLGFYNTRKRKHLWWTSAFMGIAMLARAEGLILIGVLLIVTLVIVLPRRSWYREVMAILIPFMVLVGGFVLFYGLQTGEFTTGLSGRTFYNFESGHEIIYSQTGIFNPTVSARLESREYFGTPEDNQNSVFRAIARNPEIYWLRLKRTVPSFVNFAIKAYGNKFILLFIWLSMRGLVALIKQKHFPLALMGVLWFSPWAVGFLNTFFREGYLMMPYFVVFSFSSIGLTAIIQNINKREEIIAVIGASIVMITISLYSQNTSMLYRSVLFFIGLGMVYLLRYRIKDVGAWRAHALWVLLAIGLIMRGGYSSPELPSYGESELERSVYFMQESLPPESNVLAGAPAYVWAARMTYYGINSLNIPNFADADEFLVWVQAQDIHAIYVDRHFPDVFKDYVRTHSGETLQEVFTSPARDIIIYAVGEES
jgi:4-amino-4-deoxy-L-arabinose transferase-like glycosyltransferase